MSSPIKASSVARAVSVFCVACLSLGIAACSSDKIHSAPRKIHSAPRRINSAPRKVTQEVKKKTSPTTRVPTVVPAGFELVDKPDAGFSMVVPVDWTKLDPTSKDFDTFISQLIAENEALRDFANQARQAAVKGMKIFVLSPVDPTINLSVVVVDAPKGSTAGDFRSDATSAMRLLGARDVEIMEGRLAGKESLRARALVKVNAAGQPFNSELTQYYVVSRDSMFVITLTQGTSDAEPFRTMLDSLRFR